MKIIKYQLCTEINCGTEDEPRIEQIFSAVKMGWTPANEEIAKKEAYNGEYTIIEEPDPDYEVTDEQAERELLAALTGDISAEETIKEIMEVIL